MNIFKKLIGKMQLSFVSKDNFKKNTENKGRGIQIVNEVNNYNNTHNNNDIFDANLPMVDKIKLSDKVEVNYDSLRNKPLLKHISLTKSEYDALPTKDENTIYYIP